MTRPDGLLTRIFLDSGSAEHTTNALKKLGFLDGQTTNPTYFVKTNPAVQQDIAAGKKFTTEALFAHYQQLAKDISAQIPANGSVSIEVYADKESTAEDLIQQGRTLHTWIPNAHIKLPIIPAGLEAASVLVKEGIRVNMTLCFTQEQAAAVHAATRGAKKGQVFVSPFVSRLDKIGQNGLDLLDNIKRMYTEANSAVEILAASVHSIYDIAHIIEHQMDIITIPYEDLFPWVDAGRPLTTEGLPKKDVSNLAPILYQDIDLTQDWQRFSIQHELTDAGLQQFADDWNSLLA